MLDKVLSYNDNDEVEEKDEEVKGPLLKQKVLAVSKLLRVNLLF